MTFAALFLAFVFASIYGLGAYLLFGRGRLDLALYWIAALFGFAVGQVFSRVLGIGLFLLGQLSIVEASLVSLLAIAIVRMVRRPKKETKKAVAPTR